jgi:phosphate transport system protein
MLREKFHESLKELEKEIVDMTDMVSKALEKSILSLKEKDLEEAKRIIQNDEVINKYRRNIEHKCINLIATQQPVADDLREIVAIFDIVSNLERIGDYAVGIANLVIKIGNEPLIKPLIDIPRMCRKAIEMLKNRIKAFVNRDENESRKIIEEDNEIDFLNEQILRELITYMIEDTSKITQATYLIWISHNLERTADRVTNICERTIYLVTGF